MTIPRDLPTPLNIVVLRSTPPGTLARIQAVAPGRIQVTAVINPKDMKPEQEAALREGHVALVGSSCPRDLHARMPDLLWLHAGFAGVSDLRDCDFWGRDIIMTSSRGVTGALPIAEMALTGGMMIAKDLHYAARTVPGAPSEGTAYEPWLLTNKTMGIIGLGGIGAELARLSKGLGMRVIGTRRSAERRAANVDEVDEMFPPSQLKEMAAQSHFLAVCAPSTPETFQMVDAEVLDALPDGAVVMNVARGEIIDEEALIAALDSNKLGGAYLDVYAGERDRGPDPRLANHPNVVMTPHIADLSDTKQHFAFDVFCDNLRRLLNGEPLTHEVEWERGY